MSGSGSALVPCPSLHLLERTPSAPSKSAAAITTASLAARGRADRGRTGRRAAAASGRARPPNPQWSSGQVFGHVGREWHQGLRCAHNPPRPLVSRDRHLTAGSTPRRTLIPFSAGFPPANLLLPRSASARAPPPLISLPLHHVPWPEAAPLPRERRLEDVRKLVTGWASGAKPTTAIASRRGHVRTGRRGGERQKRGSRGLRASAVPLHRA